MQIDVKAKQSTVNIMRKNHGGTAKLLKSEQIQEPKMDLKVKIEEVQLNSADDSFQIKSKDRKAVLGADSQ